MTMLRKRCLRCRVWESVFFSWVTDCVSVERMERLRHPKSFTVEVRDGEDERRHVHARKEAQTSLWNSIYHLLSSSFVNGCSESAMVKMWESRRSMPHGVAVRTSAQAEDIHEQTLLQLMRKSVVELDPLSKATECPSETRSWRECRTIAKTQPVQVLSCTTSCENEGLLADLQIRPADKQPCSFTTASKVMAQAGFRH